MKKNLLEKIGPWMMVLYGVMILYYYQTNLLAFLVNPFYNKMIGATGLILIFLGLFWIWHHQKFKLTGCEKQSPRQMLSTCFLLMIPLILAPIFKPQLLSTASALTRGVSSNLSVTNFDPTVFSKPTSERTLIEWVRILNVDPEPDHYREQEVVVQGSVILDEALPENMFHVGQFVMTCCAADARVIALPVQFEAENFSPKADEWIELQGKMGEAIIENHRQIVIKLDSAQSIPTPNDAYEILK